MSKVRRVSMKDIADKVGVSTALVSYVLTGKEKEKRVGMEIAMRIKQVAQELNYSPNQIARSLREGSTRTLGLVVADIANPFFSSMARIIEDEAKKFGYTVIFGSSDENSEKSTTLVNALLDRQVDGFIIVPADGSNDYIKLLVDRETPIVLLDRYLPDVKCSYVVLDNYSSSFNAINLLVRDYGKKRIGMVAYESNLVHMKERIRGYREAMELNGLADHIDVKEVKHAHLDKDMKKVMDELYFGNGKVEAILFATNTLSISGLYYIRRNNIKIPSELAIIGFDGNEAFDFFYSQVSYIKQPLNEMAREAVHIVIDQINGSRKVAHITLSSQLICRDSCG